jgi:hypothetical protein
LTRASYWSRCSRAIADGVVHAIGVCLGLIDVTIVVIAVNIERIEIAPILVYVSAW